MTESKIRSADNLIVKTEAEKLGKTIPETPSDKEQKIETKAPPQKVEEALLSEEANDVDIGKEKSEEKTQEKQEEETENNAQDDSSDDDNDSNEVDDYGNPISKPKMYTEEEVQAMIRKRLRDRHSEQTPQQQQEVTEAAKDFKADPASDDSWESQLAQFVEKTIKNVAEKEKNEAWKKEQAISQAEFEEKFTSGMGKYKDFETVVKGKPISNAMMMATKGMDDPAAFLYAACKQHPQELERIAKIPDHVEQIASIGRLEERMKKAKLVTTTPKPSRKISGDASDKMPERSIDQLIASHAKSKIMDKRR